MIKCTIITSIFRAESFLETFLNELLNFQELEDVEFLLLHILPGVHEKAILNKTLDDRFSKTQYIEITEHEGLYATWNRGIRLARGKYIGIWNVDDIRSVTGLLGQIKLLDENKNMALIYGDFYHTDIQLKDCSKPYSVASHNTKPQRFLEECHLTCFPMWRKEIHKQIGFFDEQFKIAGDFDFQIRVAKKFRLGKIPENLGWYYTGDIKKLSSNWECLMTEQTVIGMRYRNMKLIHPFLLFAARLRYNYHTYVFNGEKISINQFRQDYFPITRINRKYQYVILNFVLDCWIFCKKKLLKPCYLYVKNLSFLFKKSKR